MSCNRSEEDRLNHADDAFYRWAWRAPTSQNRMKKRHPTTTATCRSRLTLYIPQSMAPCCAPALTCSSPLPDTKVRKHRKVKSLGRPWDGGTNSLRKLSSMVGSDTFAESFCRAWEALSVKTLRQHIKRSAFHDWECRAAAAFSASRFIDDRVLGLCSAMLTLFAGLAKVASSSFSCNPLIRDSAAANSFSELRQLRTSELLSRQIRCLLCPGNVCGQVVDLLLCLQNPPLAISKDANEERKRLQAFRHLQTSSVSSAAPFLARNHTKRHACNLRLAQGVASTPLPTAHPCLQPQRPTQVDHMCSRTALACHSHLIYHAFYHVPSCSIMFYHVLLRFTARTGCNNSPRHSGSTLRASSQEHIVHKKGAKREKRERKKREREREAESPLHSQVKLFPKRVTASGSLPSLPKPGAVFESPPPPRSPGAAKEDTRLSWIFQGSMCGGGEGVAQDVNSNTES